MGKQVYVKQEVLRKDTGEVVEEFVQVDLEDLIKATFKEPGRGKAILDKRGHEIVNPIPVAPPLGYKREPSLWEQMRAIARQERQALLDMDPETLDEADDFEVPDEYIPESPWENDHEPSIKELRRRALEKGYRFNPSTGEYELPPEASEMSQEGGQGVPPSGGDAPGARSPLDGLEGSPQSKKPRAEKPPRRPEPSSSSSSNLSE